MGASGCTDAIPGGPSVGIPVAIGSAACPGRAALCNGIATSFQVGMLFVWLPGGVLPCQFSSLHMESVKRNYVEFMI